MVLNFPCLCFVLFLSSLFLLEEKEIGKLLDVNNIW